MNNRPERYPTLIFPMATGKDINVEVVIGSDNSESWELFALLRSARELRHLLNQAGPDLRAYNLISASPDLDRLLHLLDQIPDQARREFASFRRDRRAVFDFHTTVKTQPNFFFNSPKKPFL
jgi:hypothetical protein